MKTLKLFFVSLVMLAFTANAEADNKQKKEAETTFSVSLHCGNCQKKVENAIPYEKGVVDMKVSLEKKEVWVKYSTAKTDKEKIKAAFEKLGFTVSEVALEEKMKK